MHKPDPDTSLSESIEVFNEVVEAGKARYWAASNFAAPQIAEILRICRERNWRRPVALQPPYSLLDHKIEEDILPLCENEAIAVIPYRVLQGGLLTGKYVQGKAVPPNSRQIEKPEWTLPLSAERLDYCGRIENTVIDNSTWSYPTVEHFLENLPGFLIYYLRRHE